MKIINENKHYISHVRADVLAADYANNIDSYVFALQNYGDTQADFRRVQQEQIKLVDRIVSCQSDAECAAKASRFKAQSVVATSRKWKKFKEGLVEGNINTIKLGRFGIKQKDRNKFRQELRTYRRQFNSNCARKPRNDQDEYCKSRYDYLKYYGVK